MCISVLHELRYLKVGCIAEYGFYLNGLLFSLDDTVFIEVVVVFSCK
jgi:hypothetical protein